MELLAGEPVGLEVFSVASAHIQGAVDVTVHPPEPRPPGHRAQAKLLIDQGRVAPKEDGHASGEMSEGPQVALPAPAEDEYGVGSPLLNFRDEVRVDQPPEVVCADRKSVV